jgi:hypothetical protein
VAFDVAGNADADADERLDYSRAVSS